MKSLASLLFVLMAVLPLATQEPETGETPAVPKRYTPGNLANPKPQPELVDIMEHRTGRVPFVRTLDEVVDIDLSGVDYEAEVLLRVGNHEVTRSCIHINADR